MPNPSHRRRLVGAVATAVVVTAATSTIVVAQQARADAPVAAELQMQQGTTWWSGGQFTVRNESNAPRSWALSFSVPAGTFQNNSDWNTTATTKGDRVTVTPKNPTPAGTSVPISFGIAGTGTADLVVTACDVDGRQVGGCDTGAPGDTVAPSTPSALRADRTTATGTTLGWNASTDDTGVVGYEVTTTAAGDQDERIEQVTTTSTTLVGLTPETRYTSSVVALDASGNRSAAAKVTYTTEPETPPVDGKAPTVPTSLSATASGTTTLRATWNAATDDVAVTGYDVRIDGSRVIDAGDATRTDITGLSSDTSYRIEVRARDRAANHSAWSSPVTARTEGEQPSPSDHLVVEDGRSIAPVVPLGDADATWRSEGRWMSFSDFQPTGRYVSAGTELTLDVPSGLTTARVAIGMYTDSQAHPHKEFALRPGRSTVTAPVDGMVFLVNRATSGPIASVSVSGGKPVPTYLSGITARSDFDAQVAKWSSTPYVSIIGERIFGDFQRAVSLAPLGDNDPQELIDFWDANVDRTDEVFGFSRTASGVDRLTAHRLYISHVEYGAGYASAWDGRVTFSNRYGSAKDLLNHTEYAQHTMAHEIGHVYQLDQLRSGTFVELANEISALYALEKINGASAIDTPEVRKALADYRKTPIAQRHYADIADDRKLRMLMLDQLRRAFGDNFYAQLSHTIRQAIADGATLPYTGDQRFYALTASTAERDLRPFFAEWGIPLDSAVARDMAALPSLRTEPWTNTDRATDRLEWEVPPLS